MEKNGVISSTKWVKIFLLKIGKKHNTKKERRPKRKKKYESPELDVEYFTVSPSICTSNESNTEGGGWEEEEEEWWL